MAENGYFKTFDGTKLYYSVDGKGPPLVFLYGLACSNLHWQYQIEYFKKNYTTIWFDYRGHHRSDLCKDPEHLTIANLAHDAECLLDELKIPKAVFLGHSMGTNLVLEFYKRAPHRVSAMVLANGSARTPLESLLKSNIPQLIFPYVYDLYKRYPQIANKLWAVQGRTKLATWVVGQLGFNPAFAKESDIEQYVRMVTSMDMVITLQLLKDYERYDATPWLHKVDVPTLIISGENDLVLPRESQEILHQLIPNSQLEVIRNGSHCPQMDIPELANIIIERFLNKALPARVRAESPGHQDQSESSSSDKSDPAASDSSSPPGTL